MSENSILLIITGAPGTGKSFLARQIQERYPFFSILSYDDVKERYFDKFGFSDANEKTALNRLALEKFYVLVEEKMKCNAPLIMEYPFYQLHKPILSQFADQYAYIPITVYLYAEDAILAARCQERDQDARRHPGHLHNFYHKGTPPADPLPPMDIDHFLKMTHGKQYNVSLGEVVEINVNDYSQIDLAPLWDLLESLVARFQD